MRAKFYSMVWRDQYSGEALFYVTPMMKTSFAKNGLLKCRGVIGVYEKGTPLILDGIHEEDVFRVTGESLYVKGEDASYSFLELIDGLTERQMEIVVAGTFGDLYDFVMSRSEPEEQLEQMLKRTKDPRGTAEKITAFIRKTAEQEEMTKTLLKYGVAYDRIELLAARNVSLKDIRENPYKVCLTYNIPMIAAERIAYALGVQEYDPVRLSEFVNYSAMTFMSGGNTACTLDMLTRSVRYRISNEKDSLYKTDIGRMTVNYCVRMSRMLEYHTIQDRTYIYTGNMWMQENEAISNVMRLRSGNSTEYECASVEEVEKETGMTYNAGQRAAFEIVKTGGLKILTGPPGSGKTAVIKGLLQAFTDRNSNIEYRLAATTGTAAKVMANSTHEQTQTVNVLLNVVPIDGELMSRGISGQLDAGLIIVDESSMLDLQLFSALVQAVRTGAILLLVGDEDQLQSVGSGNILHDLIESGAAEVYRLTEIMRQSGTICEDAQMINNGNWHLKMDDSFTIIDCPDSDRALSLLKSGYRREDSQILCPVKKGKLSTTGINRMLQDTGAELAAIYGHKRFYVGDKIVMTRTSYEMGYTNGDVGVITEKRSDGFLATFGYGVMEIGRQSLCDVDLAECITIHKSQGSEFGTVHIVLPDTVDCMMTRRILYTAVTRAKKRVIIYNLGESLKKAVLNYGDRPRLTLFGMRLKETCSGKNL